MWQIWAIAAGVFLILEIFTMGFLVFWLSIGSLLAMLVSFITDNIIIQTTIFVVSSGLLIFATKPLVKKFTQKDTTKTNVYSLVGKKAIVTEDIDWATGSGQIKFEGQVWSARTAEQVNIEKGTEVEIEKIEGVKAFVKPLKEHIHN
ncbi:MAG: NfeD family protein [Clostridia bacterium]|nr:NfeD family protein [Clostridia bacterium]